MYEDQLTKQPLHDFAPLVLEELSIGVVVLSRRGVIQSVNRSAAELLGVDATAITGRQVDTLPLKSVAYRVLSENSRDEPVHISADNRYMWLYTRSVGNEHDGIDLVELHDLTRERHEIRQREEFVAMMTHDLKSPLTVMMGYVQALYGTPSPELVATCIPELDRSTKRLRGMIEDILDAYRMEVGLLQISKGPCPFGDLLGECCGEMLYEAELQGVRLSWHFTDPLPVLHADARQLIRVFANLISNAIKFTPRGGSIEIQAKAEQNHVQITISDTGIGIPEDELGKIFQKYYRCSHTAGYKGTGLGLAISKAFVEAHGGEISAASVAGKGTTFTVILPGVSG